MSRLKNGKPRRPVPLGRAIAWSEAEIAEIAQFTSDQIAAAHQLAHRAAPKLAALLAAEETDPHDPTQANATTERNAAG